VYLQLERTGRGRVSFKRQLTYRRDSADRRHEKCNRQFSALANFGELKQLSTGSRDMALFLRCVMYRMSVPSLIVQSHDPFDYPNRQYHFLFDIFNSAV
jgi:hypothetical protein